MAAAVAISWSKGKNGDWLVRGPVGLSGVVTVSKKDGSTSTATLIKPVWTGDGVALYAVAPRAAQTTTRGGGNYDPSRFNGYGRPRGGYVKKCKTDGNCSSFGSGRSCGADDCDGY